MTRQGVQVGHFYRVRVGNQYYAVLVDHVRERRGGGMRETSGKEFDVTVLTTGRSMVLKSGARFLEEIADPREGHQDCV